MIYFFCFVLIECPNGFAYDERCPAHDPCGRIRDRAESAQSFPITLQRASSESMRLSSPISPTVTKRAGSDPMYNRCVPYVRVEEIKKPIELARWPRPDGEGGLADHFSLLVPRVANDLPRGQNMCRQLASPFVVLKKAISEYLSSSGQFFCRRRRAAFSTSSPNLEDNVNDLEQPLILKK